MADETTLSAAILMDRGHPLGNSEDDEGRRALHVKAFPVGTPSVTWDAATCTQTAANVHTYQFYEGGLSGTLKQTIVLTYPTNETIPFTSVVYS